MAMDPLVFDKSIRAYYVRKHFRYGGRRYFPGPDKNFTLPAKPTALQMVQIKRLFEQLFISNNPSPTHKTKIDPVSETAYLEEKDDHLVEAVKEISKEG